MFETSHLLQHFFLGATLVVSFVAFRYPRWMSRCMLDVGKINQGETGRLLYSGFIHADYVHLAFNMITYYSFAYFWEDVYVLYWELAWWWFGVFYLSSIVVVNVLVWWVHRKTSSYRSLGASGGVSALVFSCILASPYERLYVMFFAMPAIGFAALYMAYCIYGSIYRRHKDSINHFAHLVGALYGILFSLLLSPKLWAHFLYQLFGG